VNREDAKQIIEYQIGALFHQLAIDAEEAFEVLL